MGLEPCRRDRICEGLIEEFVEDARIGRLGDLEELEPLTVGRSAIDENQDRVKLPSVSLPDTEAMRS